MPPMPMRSARGASGSGSTFSSTISTSQCGGHSAATVARRSGGLSARLPPRISWSAQRKLQKLSGRAGLMRSKRKICHHNPWAEGFFDTHQGRLRAAWHVLNVSHGRAGHQGRAANGRGPGGRDERPRPGPRLRHRGRPRKRARRDDHDLARLPGGAIPGRRSGGRDPRGRARGHRRRRAPRLGPAVDARSDERRRAHAVRLVMSYNAAALHGALMVSAFFGTVIALERAVAIGRVWAYAAPLCAGLGGVVLLLGYALPGFALMALAAALFCVASGFLFFRQTSLEMGALLAGAAAWLAGNVALFYAEPAVPWWIAFFALTIGGERLELSRYLKRGPWVRRLFAVLIGLLVVTPAAPQALGVVLVLLALWLLTFDLARVTIRQDRLPRYVAACLLAGYFWLGLGGALIALATHYDAALHAIFVGFVFSMVFGHAPVILPAVLRVRFPYHPALYLPLALLHASLAVRVFVSAPLGAWGNAAAIALFIVTAIVLVSTFDPGQKARPASG